MAEPHPDPPRQSDDSPHDPKPPADRVSPPDNLPQSKSPAQDSVKDSQEDSASDSASVKHADSMTSIGELKQWMVEFVQERSWEKYHNAKNLSMSLAIESAELMEHFQWLTSEEVERKQGYALNEVEEELADVLSYTLAIANALDIDLTSALKSKMVKNRRKYPADQQSSDRIVRREDV